MNRLATLLLALVFSGAFGNSYAQKTDDAEIYGSLLKALKYADVFRINIQKTCPKLPPTVDAQVLALCAKVIAIPDRRINQAAEPFVREHVPFEEAKRALAFWSSPEGAEISRKLVAQMRGEQSNNFSPSEVQQLDAANKSSYGLALGNFASDSAASRAIVGKVAANAL